MFEKRLTWKNVETALFYLDACDKVILKLLGETDKTWRYHQLTGNIKILEAAYPHITTTYCSR